MTAREHDPAWVEKAKEAIFQATRSRVDVTRAVLDAVADDIARAERERVLAEVEAEADTLTLLGVHPVARRLRELVAHLRGGEGQ